MTLDSESVLDVRGCDWVPLRAIGDERGWLVSLESGGNVPFVVQRVYYIFGTQADIRRGLHAHWDLEQLVICVSGSCRFVVDDGVRRREVRLDDPALGLHVRGVVWREMYDFSPDCVLMVLASQHYDESDYIRDYPSFMAAVKGAEA